MRGLVKIEEFNRTVVDLYQNRLSLWPKTTVDGYAVNDLNFVVIKFMKYNSLLTIFNF
jgi:hypothetical protein